MKKIMSSHSTAALLLALSASLLVSGCNRNPSISSTARKFNSAPSAELLGYNGSLAPKTRSFASYGEVPDTVKRAMHDYIATGEWKQSNYAYPQAFIRLEDPAPRTGQPLKESYWAVCIDTQGNLVGLLPSKDARFLPTVGDHQMIVNKTPRSAGLSYAILKGIQHSDSLRKSIRKNSGLDTPAPVAPIKIVTPPAAPKAPAAKTAAKPAAAAPAPAEKPAESTDPAASSEEDIFGTSTESTTTETATPAGETESTTTEEVSF